MSAKFWPWEKDAEADALAKTAGDIIENYQKLIKRIQDALGTEETGDALVEVARNAHKAERELAAIQMPMQE